VPGEGFVAGYLVPSLVVVAKATALMAVFSFFRSVYGRYRLDHALDIAWRVLFPVALAGFGLALLEGALIFQG